LCGCGSTPPAPNAAAPEALPVLRPASGGEMLLIPAGKFTMGDAAGRPDETPRDISVASFYMDRTPITQELFQKVMGVNPSKRKGANNPVEQTQWTAAARFCNKCSELDGLTPCYDPKTWECNATADGYRLPTEAEWEYACRAGSTAQYCFGADAGTLPQYAWFKENSGGAPHPVGQKLPNRWGLHDMHGNVWQWCNDWHTVGKARVLRGGAWDSTADKCRAAYRHKDAPVFPDACLGSDAYGFRRVRNATPMPQKTAAAAPTTNPEPRTTNARVPAENLKPETGNLKRETLRGTIVFISDRSGVLNVWTMRANGKDAKQLTRDTEGCADARFSPDGARILYTSLRGGFPEVWQMNRDGSDQKSVTKGCQADWSPDGKALVFIRDNQAWVRECATGNEKRVTPEDWERCFAPAWSPDGKRIAVACRRLDTIGIFLVSADGQQTAPLKTREQACTPRWSADGKKLLCQTTKAHIHEVAADGSRWEQLTFGADLQHDARYSPDGTMLIFCRAPASEGPWQICVQRLGADDADFVQLTKEGSNLGPDWHASEE
jgi:formylglycine-generating enzyme required for sulfatase activity